MAQKTYLLGWLALLQKIARYYGRWGGKMTVGLDPDVVACINAVINAVNACVTALGKRPVE